MEDSFCNLVSQVRLLLLTESTDYSSLKQCLKEFEKHCKKLDEDFELDAFKNLHYDEMTKVVFFIRSCSSTDAQLRAFHDRIFKNVLKFSNHVPRKITKIFDAFIQGITYFEYENPTQEPVYHRLASCGSGTDAFRKLHQQCTRDMDKIRKNQVKRNIEKCYLERQIYDAIFKEFELSFGTDDPSQDEGHRHRMEETRKDFHSCFPNVDLKVQVKFDSQMPTSLIITKSVNGVVKVREEYKKDIILDRAFGGKSYDRFVECRKITQNAEYVRVQTYSGQLKRWVKKT